MSALILPRRFKGQPQYAAPIDRTSPLAYRLSSAFVFDSEGSAVERVNGALYPVTNAVTQVDRSGRVLYFDGSGDYVNLGTQTIGGVNLFCDSTSQWSAVVRARLEAGTNVGTFLAKAGATTTSRTFHIYRDSAIAAQAPAIWLRGINNELNWGWNTAEWHQITVTWDGTTAKAYADYDRENTLSVGTTAQEAENIVFGARTGGAGFLLTGRIAYGYFFSRAITRQESIALYENPGGIFKAPPRRIAISTAAPSGFKAAWARNSNVMIGAWQ